MKKLQPTFLVVFHCLGLPCLVLFGLGLLASSTPAGAQTDIVRVGVSPSCDFPTLQSALDATWTLPGDREYRLEETLPALDSNLQLNLGALASDTRSVAVVGGFASCAAATATGRTSLVLVGPGPALLTITGDSPGGTVDVRVERLEMTRSEATTKRGGVLAVLDAFADVELRHLRLGGAGTVNAEEGGCMAIADALGQTSVEMDDVVLESCLARDVGGALFVDGAQVFAKGLKIRSTALVASISSGSGIALNGASLACQDCVIASVGFPEDGSRGALWLDDSQAFFAESSFQSLTSQTASGAMVEGASTLTLTGSTVRAIGHPDLVGGAWLAKDTSTIRFDGVQVQVRSPTIFDLRQQSRLELLRSRITCDDPADCLQGNPSRAMISLRHDASALLEGVTTFGLREYPALIGLRGDADVVVAFSTFHGDLIQSVPVLIDSYPEDPPVAGRSAKVFSSLVYLTAFTTRLVNDPDRHLTGKVDCVLTRSRIEAVPLQVTRSKPELVFFVDSSGGDLRLLETSAGVDHCDAAFWPPAGQPSFDADGDLRGADLAGVLNLHGPFDLGADELVSHETPLFADGFESGDLSAWSTASP